MCEGKIFREGKTDLHADGDVYERDLNIDKTKREGVFTNSVISKGVVSHDEPKI